MKHYIGLDVSLKMTAICIIDANGTIVMECSCPSNVAAIAKAIHRANLTEIQYICLETGTQSHHLCEGLSALSLPIVCVDARRAKVFLSMKYNKTDKNDARALAEGIRLGFFKAIPTKSKQELSLCSLLRSRRLIVDQRKQLQQSLRSLLRVYGLEIKSHTGVAFYNAMKQMLELLPALAAETVKPLLELYMQLNASIKALDKLVDKQVTDDIKLLMTIPGVGPITALTYKAEIGDPKRFAKSRNVGAYLGLTPRQSSSGEVERRGRISKMGPTQLRSLLIEAGMSLLTRTHSWSELKAWGLKIQRKHGTKKAAVALARKLAVIMHQMLLKGENFRYNGKLKESKVA